MARNTNPKRRNWGAYRRRQRNIDRARAEKFTATIRLVAPEGEVRAHYGGNMPSPQQLLDDLNAGKLPPAWQEDADQVSFVDHETILGDMIAGRKDSEAFVQILAVPPESLLTLITCERLPKK